MRQYTKSKLFLFITLVFISNVSYAGGVVRSAYAKEDVYSVVVRRIASDKISIQYSYLVESSAYSNGVNYEVKDGTLFIAIDRCLVGKDCTPMVESDLLEEDFLPLVEGFQSKVVIPYHGEKLIMRYADTDDELSLEE